MSDTRTPDFAEAMGRIQFMIGCRTQSELANLLGIRQSSVADAKKRGNIPPDWLLTLCRKLRVNPDWILTGQGTMKLQPTDFVENSVPPIVYSKEIRPSEECSIEELVIEVVRKATEILDVKIKP